jgi:TRAP-type uncharacterized transport system fused permease subunit
MVVFNDVFGISGFCSQLIYDMIPLVFWCQLKSGVLKDKKLSIISILCLYINAFIYFFLCVFNPKNEIEVMDFCNLQGSYFGIIYIILYYKYLYYQNNKLIFYLIVCSLIISSVIVILVEYSLRNKEIFLIIINWIGVIFNIGEYLPIGFDFFYLVKNKISERYTLLGAYVGIINTILWLIWSIIRTFTSVADKQNNGNEKKLHSFVANVFGLLLCLSQLVLYYIYKKDDEKDDDNENTLDDKGIDNDFDNGNKLITLNDNEHSEEKKIEDEFI